MTAVGIIPARYASMRLPGKPLADLKGKSMIRRVWEGASEARLLDRVVVATDDERIVAECSSFGAEAVLTSPDLPSGTDRIAAAHRMLDREYDIVVNIQGDEPLLRGSLVDILVQALTDENDADVATPVTPIVHAHELTNPAIVKVAMNAAGRALYFSRSPIPFFRDAQQMEWTMHYPYRKHIGLYAYRRAVLERFVSLPPSLLERAESLEQLRLLEDGASFLCVETDHHLIAVDTPEDAEAVRSLLR